MCSAKRIYGVMSFSILLIFFSFSEPMAAPYYEGKVLKILVGHEAGGGYDRYARVMAKHLPKHIPGKPTVLVENMPGASTIICANYLFNIAKPDGQTIGIFDRSLPFAQIFKAEGVKFDLLKYSWVGSVASEAMILVIRSDLPYKTIYDLQKTTETIYLATTGPAASAYQFPALAKAYLGLNIQFVIYPSSAADMLAIEKKEVWGKGGSYSSLSRYIDSGLVRPVLRSRVSDQGIENLPVDEDLANDKKAKTVMAMRSASDQIGRPFVAPPKTPPEIMAFLRDGFAKAAKDPELQAEATKMKLKIEYDPPEDCTKQISLILNQPEEIVKEFGKYIKF